MRQFLFLLGMAYLTFSSFFSVAQTPDKAYYNLSVASNAQFEPEFIDGLLMDAHNKKTTIKNIVDVIKTAGPSTPDAGAQQKKFTVINNQVVLVNNDHAEMTDSARAVAKTTEPIESTEPETQSPTGKNRAAEQINAESITEVTVETTQPADEEIVEPVISKYAEMISVDPTEITNYPLYRFIDEWYGIRYKWGGTDKHGIDCSAFSQKLYARVYSTEIDRTAKEQHRGSERIKHYDEATEGDLIFFRIHRLRVSHVGVYLANGYFVHASRSKGVVISNLDTRYWRTRYAGCGHVSRTERSSESDFIQ
jgi:cell wall-associated NlpC family hydrolase